MNNRCIICGREANTLTELKTKRGSIVTVPLCSKHEKARLLGKRKIRKGLRKSLKGAF